ncbi:Mif2/CENP-C like-domain-containing protein [Biscogniauxia marginata]|nr:Mif2/CENP-C like-domain-containing protein [Biscogniauxia marginata]
MPPRSQAQRRTSQQAEHVFELGKVGRKTGVMLPDTGKRDEHGFEEMDGLFSSPEKEIQDPMNGHDAASEEEEEEGEDMDLDNGSDYGPGTIRRLQREGRPSLPRARSPIKTNLQSPARQNPHIGPSSSPTRGTVVGARERSPKPTVARRLDFTVGPQSLKKPTTNGQPKVNGTKSRNGKLTNGHAHDDESDEEAILQGRSKESEDDEEDAGESMQMLDIPDDDDGGILEQDDSPEEFSQGEEDEEQPMVQEAKSANKSKTGQRRGRKPKTVAPKEVEEVEEEEGEDDTSATTNTDDNEEEPVRKKGGRTKGRPQKEKPPREPTPPAKELKYSKRGRPARNSNSAAEEEENNDEVRETKRQRTADKANKAALSKPTATKEKGKPGRERKSSGVGVDSPVVQRGPPLPKGRGLVTLRREESDGMRTTRSGRASYKPLEFWKGERVEYDEGREEIFDDRGRHFVMPTLKGVVRAETNYEAAPKRRRGRPSARSGNPGRPSRAVIREEEEVEREDWEYDTGHITGECVFWYPEHEHSPPQDEDDVEVIEEELAIAEPAIQLRDIKDATFKFAKTQTLPFFGSGIVDLPPGSEKRSKNARKMQMVFFVHTGSVQVTVSQTSFKIAKGGMWFVPRGNHYSIANESNRPSRIFFAQGCEVLVTEQLEEQE